MTNSTKEHFSWQTITWKVF